MKSFIQGDANIYLNLALVPKALGAGYEAGVRKAGEYLLGKSQEIVPYDTGELHDSGYSFVFGMGLEARLFVGYNTPYAVFVHEDPRVAHDYPTRYKFLEEPAERYRHYMMEIIRREIHKHWRMKLRSGVPLR